MLTEISARAVRVSRHVDAEDGAPIRGRVAFEEWLLDERDPARSPVGAFTAGVFSLSNPSFRGCRITQLNRQKELEPRPVLSVRERRKSTAMNFNNPAANS
jgi:hypothetical protein